jgi:hypothetical protein
VNALLDKHIGHVAKRIKELKLLQKNLRGLRNLCQQAQSTKDCGILQSLEARWRTYYNHRILSTGTAACTRHIDDPLLGCHFAAAKSIAQFRTVRVRRAKVMVSRLVDYVMAGFCGRWVQVFSSTTDLIFISHR